MINRKDIIKHAEFMDVAFQLVRPPIVTASGKLKLKGIWINQAFEQSYIIDHNPKKITIIPEQIENWYRCQNPDFKCLRYATWEKIK